MDRVDQDSAIPPPVEVRSADDLAWDREADLVVVGFGGAGAAAALEGAERGGKVIAVDRFDGGGATAFSGGIYYAAETDPQKEAGIEDSVDEMYKYLHAEGTPAKDLTLKRFCERSPDNFKWVSRFVPYDGSLYSAKATYPPEGKFLYYSGNEKAHKFAAVAKPAPRGHRAVGQGWTGHVFYAGLRKAVLDAGVELLTHCPVRRLVTDTSGRVLGVEIHKIPEDKVEEHRAFYKRVNPHLPMRGAQSQKAIEECARFEAENFEIVRIRATRGVVLSAGGYINNLRLLQRHRPELAKSYREIMRLGSMGCDGSGIALGLSAGGQADLMGNMFIGKSLSPPEDLVRGVLVNADGQRFVNEDAYISLVGGAVAEQPNEGFAYLVMDGSTFWRTFRTAATYGKGMFLFFGLPVLLNMFMGGTKRARTVAKLARKLGVNAAALQKTISDYNDRAASGREDPFGKLSANTSPISGGSYYALNMSIRNKFGLTQVFSLGGLLVNEETGQARRPDGSSIEGLYAAGRTAVGLCSKGYMSGMSLADLVFSGRRAASHALSGSTP
jgi:3-oxo-5alpha-steroid 4-dehydrogenase